MIINSGITINYYHEWLIVISHHVLGVLSEKIKSSEA